ncbi:MAG TPA: PhzF family phenazine biosynthesis protein [Holophaga sp.]|nr:PhzF family phenazine biosynthesis protein [Holophaga sp.]
MKRFPLYQIDAFAERPFAGNPAAVMPLQAWLSDETMQAIAAENNLSETAFFVPEGDGYHIRWFMPVGEIDLCGHATLASAFVVLTELEPGRDRVAFTSMSGPLVITREGERFCLDFPRRDPRPVPCPEGLAKALGAPVRETWHTRDLFALLEDEATVRGLKPDLDALSRMEPTSFVVTAPGKDCDFVSRCFAPREGIPEDPVTGSTHCVLVPYWAQRLGKTSLLARQVSKRGGELACELRGERVRIAGKAVKVIEGAMLLDID